MAVLNQSKLELQLDSTMWKIQSFDVVESTNIVVKNQIKSGNTHGFAACALKQEGGYGRQGRQWVSPYGGLYISFSLSPSLELSQLSTFALVVSLAVAKTIEHYCPEGVGIKWPNDLLINQAKVTGISLEVTGGTSLCTGVGINVFRPEHQDAPSGKYQPTYLAEQEGFETLHPGIEKVASSAGLAPNQAEVIEGIVVSFLSNIQSYYEQWSVSGFAPLREEYLSKLCFMGATIEMQAIDSRVIERGTIVDVDARGRLVIKKSNESLQALNSGEVHIVALPD
ncbi:MAG: biotin--[acetyl-CoA-carboxylase] ligase [Anaerotardibacter sp.]